MNVQVRHNGTNISGFTISYEREHKICTGIGTLRVEVDRTIPRTFDPWDSIDIHENGSFKCRYYISSVEDLEPKGTLILECQDISKRLVDYFIPTSYTIDYPSYTRYWIEKFLTEAGLTYQFNTSSQGQLISNNTQLGLISAYEQLLTLLQMSGWYIYFNQAGKAVIGPLDADLAISTRSAGRGDILDIVRISDDKMLRNRALVLGAFDPYTLKYATADVTVHTRWNYDHRDVRAVVISNSNIPNKGSAYRIANQIIKEFAKITVEKHITLWGARNYNLGEAMRVTSTVWRGKGLITTFGTSMSKQGLVTNIILDERCPRLFGFFDYGDYVYVGTFGDGIWKKHLKFDPTFYDFSSGLTNLNITDLHINNGVFGSVAASGEIYWNLEDGSWNPLTLSGLVSSLANEVPSGQPLVPQIYSGLMGRAVIVDKFSNIVKFGIDTYSGLNYGDYFMDNFTTSGIVSSGVVLGSGMRSWIVEYDVMNGDYGGTAYPVSYSGDYNFAVVDLENDGVNDYISVRGGNGSGVFVADGYDLGNYDTSPFINSFDIDSVVAAPVQTIINSNRTASYNPEIKSDGGVAFFDDAFSATRCMISISFNGNINKRAFSLSGGSVVGTTTSHTLLSSSDIPLAIHKLENQTERYRVFYARSAATWLFGADHSIYYKEWDVPSNTISAETSIYTSPSNKTHFQYPQYVVLGGFLYVVFPTFTSNGGNFGGRVQAAHELWLYSTRIDMENAQLIHSTLLHHVATTSYASTYFEYFTDSGSHAVPATGGLPLFAKFSIFQNGDEQVRVLGWYEYGKGPNPLGGAALNDWHEYFVDGDDLTVSVNNIYNGTFRFNQGGGAGTLIKTQLTKNRYILGMVENASTGTAWYTDGSVFNSFTGTMPYYVRPSTVYPVYSREWLFYIAYDGTDFWACHSLLLTPVMKINGPSGYSLRHPYCNATTYGDEIFWLIWDNNTFERYLAKTSSIFDASGATIYTATINGSTTTRGFNVGGFFAHGYTNSSATPVTYFYFIGGELEFPSYMVLQREGSDFNLIQRASYPIRLDISNNSPVLTVGSGEGSFVSNFVYDTELEQVIYVSGVARRVEDYRYTYLEATYSGAGGITTSGNPVTTMGLYVTASGIYGGDVITYSGGFQIIYTVPSGLGNRIETSNYGIGGQYVFVTTSGDNPIFYQADPEQYSFTAYSGLPDSRATIIRLDDRI